MKPYYETENGRLFYGDCLDILPELEQVDLTITSPPYGGIRDYHGYNFNFETIAKELFRTTKDTGAVVWVVKDEMINGSESGESFRQALYFKEIGFKLVTMLYTKNGGLRTGSTLFYQNNFEYVFILTKTNQHTFNPIKDRININAGQIDKSSTKRKKDGSLKPYSCVIKGKGYRDNVWKYNTGGSVSSTDKIAYNHPAIFPEALVQDHILSWSNEGDIVIDPMCGSGTTLKMAERLGRKWIGIETSLEYCAIAKQRIERELQQRKLPGF